MNYKDYKTIVKNNSTKNNKLKNSLIAFAVGGLICLSGEVLTTIIENIFHISNVEAITWMSLLLVFLAVLFTSCGFFDKWMSYCKAGLIIPTTGFAHSISSCVLDYKKDGLITGIGSNIFKLAGSVILYGVVSAFFLTIIKVVFCG